MRKRPYRFGFFAAAFRESYQTALWQGALDAAEDSGSSLVFFGGNRLSSPQDTEASGNIVYRIASPESLSGVIVATAAMGIFVGQEELRDFCASFSPLPLVSVGIEIEGIPSVLVDVAPGMRDVCLHLIEVHGYRNFAFVSGPELHTEACERLRVFQETLTLKDIQHDHERLFFGDFTERSGRTAVADFFARGVLKAGEGRVDAIVAANDKMAMGAIEELEARGIKVPQDIAVVGFDDFEESGCLTPPLTTVSQPVYDLGRKAFELLLAKVEGRSESLGLLPSRAIIRESCGCPSPILERIGKDGAGIGLPPEASREDEGELLSALRNGDEDSFLRRLSVLIKTMANPWRSGIAGPVSDPGVFHDLLSGLSASIRMSPGPAPREKISLILEKARTLLGETGYRAAAHVRMLESRQMGHIQRLGSNLVSVFDREQLMDAVWSCVSDLGIPSCYLSLYDNDNPVPEFSRLLLAMPSKSPRVLGSLGIRFRTKKLLPHGIAEQAWPKTMILLPLVFHGEQQGMIMFGYSRESPPVYEMIRDQVASALKGADLLRMVRNHQIKLEIEVKEKTLELRESNERLKEEIDRRKLLEKEIIDISGEVMSRIGQDLHDGISQNLAGLSLLASALGADLAAEGHKAAEKAQELAEFLNETIIDTRKIARGLYPVEFERNGLVKAIEELATHARKVFGAEIELIVRKKLHHEEASRAIHIYRIVQEALGNALKHSGASRITIILDARGDTVSAEIIDDGKGISEAEGSEKGMGMRIMRYRANAIGAQFAVERLEKGTCVSVAAKI